MTKSARKWGAVLEGLIGRVRALSPAEGPFELGPGMTVIDPAKFHATLLSDIEDGPDGPRARLGGLRTDLENYLRARGK